MSYKELKSPHGKFHPVEVAHYEPQRGMSQQRSFSKTQYDKLTDKSTYAEYAWEFLRRNKFYQALIDAGTDNKAPHYPLPSWGYRQSDASEQNSEWEHHCGLWREPYKHYSEAYSDELTWYPIEYLRQHMCGAVGQITMLEDKSTQLHITIDLGHKFGPNVSGLKKQLEIAEKAIIAIHNKVNNAGRLGQLEASLTTKGVLRRYLYIADLFTGERSIKKEIDKRNNSGDVPIKKIGARVLSVKEIAAKINAKQDDHHATTDSIGKDADEAFKYIYQWKCLKLLTLTDKPQTELQK
jgi:hypothetical protein